MNNLKTKRNTKGRDSKAKSYHLISAFLVWEGIVKSTVT